MTPVMLVTFAAVSFYAIACWVRPFGRCSRCKGAGIHQTFITHRYQPCRSCRGAGLRLRIGRRVYNYLAAVQRGGANR
ncbi:hypothetical protein AB0J72_19845 [Dactylosporangium sp. NPDC049742]|uniref:hypothetical protein n=1 Tax=Dactylosporangium sp. NPDC049742 TaxID=3154737 RepID=UPI0034350694